MKFARHSIGVRTSSNGSTLREGAERNSTTAILYSYDAQAGSYTRQIEDPRVRELKDNLGRHLAAILDEFAPNSVLEAGTGEATSLVPILRHLRTKPAHILGFDLSLSRLLFAHRHLAENVMIRLYSSPGGSIEFRSRLHRSTWCSRFMRSSRTMDTKTSS